MLLRDISPRSIEKSLRAGLSLSWSQSPPSRTEVSTPFRYALNLWAIWCLSWGAESSAPKKKSIILRFESSINSSALSKLGRETSPPIGSLSSLSILSSEVKAGAASPLGPISPPAPSYSIVRFSESELVSKSSAKTISSQSLES